MSKTTKLYSYFCNLKCFGEKAHVIERIYKEQREGNCVAMIFMRARANLATIVTAQAPTEKDKNQVSPCQFSFLFLTVLSSSFVSTPLTHITAGMTILSLRNTLRLAKPVNTRGFFNSCVVSAKAKAQPNPYTNTILLPKTNFPLRADAANREHLFKDRCTKELYPWQVKIIMIQSDLEFKC